MKGNAQRGSATSVTDPGRWTAAEASAPRRPRRLAVAGVALEGDLSRFLPPHGLNWDILDDAGVPPRRHGSYRPGTEKRLSRIGEDQRCRSQRRVAP